MASVPITLWKIDGKTIQTLLCKVTDFTLVGSKITVETVADFIFLGSKITADGECSHKIEMLTPWKESYDQPRQHVKKQRYYFVNKGLTSQGYGFSSSHVWM